MPKSKREIDLLTPVATALGQTVIEWNDMHESFGDLFAAILYPNEAIPDVAWAVWHSTKSDKA